MKEQDIQRSIKDYLEALGWLVLKFNNVGIKKPDGSYIPTHQPGVADLICCSPNGVFVAIEVKRPGNKPTDSQKEFLRRVNKCGGWGLWARSVDEVIDDLNALAAE